MGIGPPVDGMYTIHIGFKADDDKAAAAIADAFFKTSGDWTEYLHLTDANDWAEHVELKCFSCGKAKPELVSIGEGHRYCWACIKIKNDLKRKRETN
jgi:hypothetical protein